MSCARGSQLEMLSIFNISEGSWGHGVTYKERKRKTGSNSPKLNDCQSRSLISVVSSNDSSSEEKEYSIEEYVKPINKYILPHYYLCMFGNILEDAVQQMRILAKTGNEIKTIKIKSDRDILLRKKFGVQEQEVIDELAGIDETKLACVEYKMKKLDAEKIYVTDVVTRTYAELSLEKSFKVLQDNANALLTAVNYRIALAEEEARNRLIRRDLIRQLRQLRNHIKSTLYDADVKIDERNSQLADAFLVSECRSRYIGKWQEARTEQHHGTINEKELIYSKSTEHFKQMTDNEQRVHMEVEMINTITINETLEKVDKIMDKFDVNMESIELKIQIQKNDYQNMMDKRMELQKIIELHDNQILEWVHFKDEREKARLYGEKMADAAIVVQAWWRGLLVRLQIGPYKPNKKRGGAGKKNK